MDNITRVLEAQRRFSAWAPEVRLDALRALFDEIKASQPQICEALKLDLGKSEFESIATETSIVLEELAAMIRKLPESRSTTASKRLPSSITPPVPFPITSR